MAQQTPWRFNGNGPPPQPIAANQSWNNMTMHAPGTMPGSTPMGAMGATGTGTMGVNPATSVSAPSMYPSPAAKGPVSGAVQNPALSGMNGNVVNTPAVSGAPPATAALQEPAAPANSAPTLARTAASALVAGANATPNTPTPTYIAGVPAPYTTTNTTANILSLSTPAGYASSAPVRGGRGATLSDEDKLLLLRTCLECQATLRLATKTAFWRRVSHRFEQLRGRPYSDTSCERTIAKLTDARRAALKSAARDGKEVLSDLQRISLLVDRMIEVQDEVEEQTREKEARLTKMYASLEEELPGMGNLRAQPRTRKMETMNDYYQSIGRGETQVSTSVGSGNRSPQGSNNSNSCPASPIDLTKEPTTNKNKDNDKDNDRIYDFDSAVISELSKIRQLLIQRATGSVASPGSHKESTASIAARLDRLEQQFAEMKKTLDQQTGVLSDQNTVLRQLLTMMSHGWRVSQGPWPQGFPPQGFPPQGYPPQGVLPQGVPAQGAPPQVVPPQGVPPGPSSSPQGHPPQPQGGTFGILRPNGPQTGSVQNGGSNQS